MISIFLLQAPLKAASPIMIAQVQAGSSNGASQEFASLYNSGSVAVDITYWCLLYNSSLSKPGCIIPPDTQTTLWLKPGGFTMFASADFVTANTGFNPTAAPAFIPGLSDTNGQLTLLDASKTIVDQMTWTKKPIVGNIYQRGSIVVPGGEPVTNIETNGWGQAPLTLPPNNGLEEVITPIYVCPNLGSDLISIPPGFEVDENGSCFVDEGPNISGIQITVPSGFHKDMQDECKVNVAPITITEVLPNASGVDTGKEFVELYNAGDEVVSLQNYKLFVGPNYENSYIFPSGTSISAHSYMIFSDTELGFVLPNTSTKLKLETTDGQVVSEVPPYVNPPDDMSWSLINNTWQFTNRSSPGNNNLASYEPVPGRGEGEVFEDCPIGKYRNPETNRCRNFEDGANSLTPCAADQVRNPDTNRCRSILTSGNTLASCSPGQTRNPETNRCRGSAATSSATLTPCGSGQERNPETNRCRKIGSSSSSSLKSCPAGQERNATTNRCRKKANSELEKTVKDIEAPQEGSQTGWLLAAGAITGFGGYGVWEWRSEIAIFFRKMRSLLAKNPPTD